MKISLKDVYDHYFVTVITPVSTFFQRIFSYGRKKQKGQWDLLKDFKPEEFSKELNLMPYKEDKFLGVKVDSQIAFQDPNLFFEDYLQQRDCDEFAAMWYHYGKHHKGRLFTGGTVITIHEKDNKENTYHMTTVLLDMDNRCILCDYTYGPVFDSFYDAMRYLKVKYGYKNDIIWIGVKTI